MSLTFRHFFFLTSFCLMGTIMIPYSDAGEESGAVLRAGAAKSNITPPLGVSLAGHMRDRKASHIHDELFARSLVLDNGKTRIVIIICDLMAIGGDAVVKAKELIQERTGIPPENILIAATHSHTAPTTVHVFQSEPEQEYIEWMIVRIADSAQRAVNNLQPAQIGWGIGCEDRLVFNRRSFLKPGTMPKNPWGRTDDKVKMNPGSENPNIVKPAGPIDPDLPLLAVKDLDGDPIAVIGNYTLHYVGGGNNNEVSADYFGVWTDIIEREWGSSTPMTKPPCVAMLTNGCSGDINNIDPNHRLKQPYPYHQMYKVARIAANEALLALQDIEYHKWVPLAMRVAPLEFGVRKPSAQEVQEAKEILEQTEGELKTLQQIYARETVLIDRWEDTAPTLVQSIQIGDVGIVTLPGEAFVELGLEVKEKSPFPVTFCIELANDYRGYIPTEAAHELGGYETWRARSSYLAPNAAPEMVRAGLKGLREMYK